LVELIVGLISRPRARFFADKLQPFFNSEPGKSMLDIGCGTGHIAAELQKRHGFLMNLLDLAPRWGYVGMWLIGVPSAKVLARRLKMSYSLYDGEKLPQADQSIDDVLLAFVLHHSHKPEQLLSEAVRVARKRVYVFEDIPEDDAEAARTEIFDSIVNAEVSGHAHENKTREEWLELFEANGLKLVHEEAFKSKLLGMTFPNTLFVLEKK
jgi:ubiquinone/menaquinone biosynthesis C-methylase UbiE